MGNQFTLAAFISILFINIQMFPTPFDHRRRALSLRAYNLPFYFIIFLVYILIYYNNLKIYNKK